MGSLWISAGHFCLRGDRMCNWRRRRMWLMKWVLKICRSHRVGQGKVRWIWQMSLNWIKCVFILSGLFQSVFLPQRWQFPTIPIWGVPQLLERLVVCIVKSKKSVESVVFLPRKLSKLHFVESSRCQNFDMVWMVLDESDGHVLWCQEP